MENIAEKGIISLLPIVLALFLAFLAKDAVFSLVIGCIAEVVVAGFDPATGFSKLFQQALALDENPHTAAGLGIRLRPGCHVRLAETVL